VVPNGPAV